MSKATPKKAAAPKAEESKPMDPTAKEVAVGAPSTNSPRVCYAAKTLVAEVQDLFPETPVEYSNSDGRNTALDVTFDLTGVDSTEQGGLASLLTLVESDPRVAEVLADEGSMLVSFKSNPRTQDSREPFGLVDALDVLWDEGSR